MTTPGITHEYGPWSPMRFIPVAFRTDAAPAFWITTARICRGLHDHLCRHAQNQTFGPLVLEGGSQEKIWVCPNCCRHQPPVDGGDVQQTNCLFCSQGATVQQLGDPLSTPAAVSSVAALHGATTMLRQVTAPSAIAALLDGTAEGIRELMDHTAWAIQQEPTRALHAGNAALVLIARQILANARGNDK